MSSERETKRKTTARENSNASFFSLSHIHRVLLLQPRSKKKHKQKNRLVAALEHHLSEWQRVGAPELVRQCLEEEKAAATNKSVVVDKGGKKKSRFRRASATALEVSALPPPTPPLVSSRPEPYLLTLHIPLCRSSDSSSLTAAGVAEGDVPPGLGPHVSWGREEREREGGGEGGTSPSFAHRAAVWFGAGGPLVTLSPATYSRRVLDTDAEAVTLVSALAVASGATGCPWPSCVPAGDGRRDGWLGVGPRGGGLVESEACRRLAARARGPPRGLAAPAGAAALLAARAAPRAPRAAEALRAALEPDAGIAAAALAATAAPLLSSSSSSPRLLSLPPPVRLVVEVDARATYRVPLPPPIAASEAAAEKGREKKGDDAAAAGGGGGWDAGAPWRPWLLFPRCYPDPCRAGIEVDACWDAVPGGDALGLNEEEEEEEDEESGDDDDEDEAKRGGAGRGRGGVRASSAWRLYALAPEPSSSSSSPGAAEEASGGAGSGSAGADAPAAAAANSGDAAAGVGMRPAPLRLLPAVSPSPNLPPPPVPTTGGLASLVARLAAAGAAAALARSMRDLGSDGWWDARGTDARSPVWPLPRAPAAEAVAAAVADVLDLFSDEAAVCALLPEAVLAAARRGEQGALAAVAALRRFAAPPPIPSSSFCSSHSLSFLPRLAPAASLASRLALRAAALAASSPTGDARAVAALWSGVVRELRFSRWERGRRLPRATTAASEETESKRRTRRRKRGEKSGGNDSDKPRLPDKGASLLHQKLQMLDCCIAARVAASERAAAASLSAAARARLSLSRSEGEEDDEEGEE